MALGHCRHRIHSLGWSIVMFFLIYWACIDEPWVSLVTRVQSAIKKRSNLLKNVSFTQAGLHIWAATALPPSIMNTPPAWQMGNAALPSLSPTVSGPLPQTLLAFSYWQKWSSRRQQNMAREHPDLPVLLTDGCSSEWFRKRKAAGKSCPWVASGTCTHCPASHPTCWGEASASHAEGKGLHLRSWPAPQRSQVPLVGDIWELHG